MTLRSTTAIDCSSASIAFRRAIISGVEVGCGWPKAYGTRLIARAASKNNFPKIVFLIIDRSNFNKHSRLSIYRWYGRAAKFDPLKVLCLHWLDTRDCRFIVNRKYLFFEYLAPQPNC